MSPWELCCEKLTLLNRIMSSSDGTGPSVRIHEDHLKQEEANMKKLSLRTRKISTSDDLEKQGLLNIRAFLFLVLWYFFSFCTLFLNKYILATLKGDPTLLGELECMFFGVQSIGVKPVKLSVVKISFAQRTWIKNLDSLLK